MESFVLGMLIVGLLIVFGIDTIQKRRRFLTGQDR